MHCVYVCVCACVHDVYVCPCVGKRTLSLSVTGRTERKRALKKQWQTVEWKTLRAQLLLGIRPRIFNWSSASCHHSMITAGDLVAFLTLYGQRHKHVHALADCRKTNLIIYSKNPQMLIKSNQTFDTMYNIYYTISIFQQ